MTVLGPRREIVLAMAFALLVMAVRTMVGLHAALGLQPPARLALVLAVAGVFYLVSHGLRALRLAVITVPLLGLGLRKAAMLHFFVAPWSLVMPVKLDELIRVNELAIAGRSWPNAIMALLIDRVVDALVLVALILMLAAYGIDGNGVLAIVLAGALLVLGTTFLAAPIVLATAQRHVFAHHHHARAADALRVIDAVRRLVLRGRATIAATAPLLVMTSACICALELAASALTLAVMTGRAAPLAIIDLVVRRTDQSWRMIVFNQPVDPQVAVLTLAFVLPMFVAWLLVVIPYCTLREPARRDRMPGYAGVARTAFGLGEG